MPTWRLHQGLALEPTECVATVLGLAQIFREMGARTIAGRGNPDRRRHSRARRNKRRSRSATVARPQRCARLGSAPICGRASVRRAPETAPARSAGRHRSPAPLRRGTIRSRSTTIPPVSVIRHPSQSRSLVFPAAAERCSRRHYPRTLSKSAHDRLPSPNCAPAGPPPPRPADQQSMG